MKFLGLTLPVLFNNKHKENKEIDSSKDKNLESKNIDIRSNCYDLLISLNIIVDRNIWDTIKNSNFMNTRERIKLKIDNVLIRNDKGRQIRELIHVRGNIQNLTKVSDLIDFIDIYNDLLKKRLIVAGCLGIRPIVNGNYYTNWSFSYLYKDATNSSECRLLPKHNGSIRIINGDSDMIEYFFRNPQKFC